MLLLKNHNMKLGKELNNGARFCRVPRRKPLFRLVLFVNKAILN